MITIKIDNKEIYIPEGISLSLEMSNSLFNTEKIEGEIIFTFDVPAEKNDVIFAHARYVYVQKKKSYEAIISVGGIEIAKGNLIIQSSKPNTYSCGIVMNPYPIDFAERLLKDNDYGDQNMLGKEYKPNTIYYTQSGLGYTSKISHLGTVIEDSLDANSNFKFGMFVDMDFFGNDIQVFGNVVNNFYFVDKYPFWGLFSGLSPNVPIEYANSNTYASAIAPQIKLLFLLKSLFRTTPYKLIGSALEDKNIDRIFYQSLRGVLFKHIVLETEIFLTNHCPNLTNAMFINTFCQLFGCTYYLDSNSKTIEISLAKDLHKTKHINLSNYLIINETTIERKDNDRYTYQLDSIVFQEIDEKNTIPPVASLNTILYFAFAEQNAGKICFAKDANAYYISVFDTDMQRWQFVLFGGNSKTISNKKQDGNQTGTQIKPNAKIPTLIASFAEIPLKSVNQPEPSDNQDFDLILNYYVNEQSLATTSWVGRYSYLQPLDANLPLTVDGENSLGQTYAMPYLKILGSHEPVTMQFLLPLHIFLEVRNLLKPQNAPTEMQIRWIMVNNIKMLPIQMKFEFTAGEQFIKAEIKMAKITVEI